MKRRTAARAGSGAGRAALTVATALLACWLGGAGSARAAGTFFVDGANPACSNTGPGTEAAPYCTISAAAAARGGAGTTLLVKPAVYREQVTIPASGAAGSPFTLQALGAPVVVDGADNFSSSAQWSRFSGDVWLAASVTWSPKQVFADGARLTPSSASPGSLPPRTFRFISGQGLYVNAGGGNPATHQTLVGRRSYGFRLSGRSWVTIDGFTVTRTEDRAIYLSSSSNNTAVTRCTLTFANHYGIQVEGSSDVLVGSNAVSDHHDHGIAVTSGSTRVTIQDNESFRNARPAERAANGVYVNASSGNVIRGNRLHHNQDSGWNATSSANNNLSLQNLSWSNGDHGFDQLNSKGSVHVGDVAWGNLRDGFSVQGTSTGTQIFDSISVNNGLTTGRYNLMVESGAASGFVSNYNIFWNVTSQPPIRHSSTEYATLAAFTAATGQDARSLQADPLFRDPAGDDFRLRPGAPAIDSANSSVPNWPATDAAGRARVDDPATPNTGAGPVPYADRGALEFVPSAVPQAALTVTPSSGPAPLTVTLDASGSSDPDGTIIRYEFDPGDGTPPFPQPGPVATHTYAAGTFTARVLVTDNDGASDSATATVTAIPPNQAPVAALTVTPASGPAPLAVTADASGSSDSDGSIASYLFDFGDGTVVGPQPGPTAPHTYAAGTWTATVVVTDNDGATGSASQAVTVSGNQPPDGAIDSPAVNVTIEAGQSVPFAGSGSDPDGNLPLSFLWDFGGGAANQTVEDPGPVTFNTAGTYTVTFTVTDSLGVADPTPATRMIMVTAPTTSNLVGNPSFESDTAGWKPYGSATIQRVAGGVDGAFAVEVTGSPTSTSQFGIDDAPSWVTTTPAVGTRYRFTAWVRSERNTGLARLRIREYLAGSQVGTSATRSPAVTLSPSWQMLTVDHVTGAAGSRLDVQVLDYAPVTTGEVFQVDSIAIQIIP